MSALEDGRVCGNRRRTTLRVRIRRRLVSDSTPTAASRDQPAINSQSPSPHNSTPM